MTSKRLTAIPADQLSVEHKKLFVPSLEEAAKVLQTGLLKNFAEASVNVVQCPNLTQDPFNLAAEGLNGSPRLVEVGGVPNLIPLVNRHKIYNMKDYPKLADMGHKNGFIVGAGAADWTVINRCAELMPNILVKPDGTVVQKTHLSRTFDEDGSFKQMAVPQHETNMALLGNLFLSEGKPGPVLEVRCKKRTGEENLVSCMRKTLLEQYPESSIGVGGTFLIKEGKAKIHVMPDFSACPIHTDEEVAKWLKFYEMSAPFVTLSYFVSKDPGLDLRVEHSHGFSKHGDAGHYHHDTTPETVEYVGYFNFGEYCYRIDRPKETHQVGRD